MGTNSILVVATITERNQWADSLYNSEAAALRAAIRDWFVDGIPSDGDAEALVTELDASGWLRPAEVDGDGDEFAPAGTRVALVERADVVAAMQAVLAEG